MTRRPASEIGAGLEPVRPARALRPGERIHVVGAAGAAGAAAALHAHLVGAAVSGCDAGGPSQYTQPLADAGIPLSWEHAPTHVAAADRVLADRLAVSKALTAIAPGHPELAAARLNGVPVSSLQQLIADSAATRGQSLIGIAGTHGKSTTTGWVVHLLVAAGLDPSAFVGALLPAELTGTRRPSTVRVGGGPQFVVEADEYAGNFDPYDPRIIGLLNADWDHPDVFADRAAVVAAFTSWIRGSTVGSVPTVVVANAGDPGVGEVLDGLRDWPGRLVAAEVVGEDADPAGTAVRLAALRTGAGAAVPLVARWRWMAGQGSLEIDGLDPAGPRRTVLALAGRHNAENALIAAGVALAAGAAPDSIVAGLATFPGVGRRLELKGDVGGVVVLDDYGHHPTAIAATFAAVRDRYPGRRLWGVYEPLTYHRTAAMLGEFAAVLGTADRAVVADVHAGRDPDTTITSAQALADAVTRVANVPAVAPGSVEATADWLAGQVEAGDVVLVMGGGRSYVVAERLVARLRGRRGS